MVYSVRIAHVLIYVNDLLNYHKKTKLYLSINVYKMELQRLTGNYPLRKCYDACRSTSIFSSFCVGHSEFDMDDY